MNAQDIKDFIIINDRIEYVLEELGCHHIKPHDNYRYITCAFPNGDNRKGMSILTDSLYIDSYTKNIKDKWGNSNIVSLVSFIKNLNYFESLKWLCDILGINYYEEDTGVIPKSLLITKMLMEMNEGINVEDDIAVKPIDENILNYYKPYLSKLFYSDGIGYDTQQEFEVMFDLSSCRYVIPIRDELGTLVGVKGRYFDKKCPSYENKYIYLEPCSKSKILYGLYKTIDYIKEKNQVIVVESEKNVMLLWHYGIRNCVAIGGHILSKTQVEKLTRLNVSEIILCYDEDVNRNDKGVVDKKLYKEESSKFIPQIKVSAMVDINRELLNINESPSDDINKFNILYESRKVLQNGTGIH